MSPLIKHITNRLASPNENEVLDKDAYKLFKRNYSNYCKRNLAELETAKTENPVKLLGRKQKSESVPDNDLNKLLRRL